ncbi:gliding motility protein [Litoribacter alkaliphilus]|uniref:Gliding motility protein n=1 Tax=Litoribacter ruber TaxID=702568 RepID=A0AAP2CJ76_9BACT|nr:gliding motility protein [Litoribacter alkaliphilus]MBS9524216.1 gliding motility protein [Litoribacter alkaliphilus]
MTTRNRFSKYLFSVFLLGMLVACSAERNTFTSRLYHNTTARYNAYFLAKEKIAEVEQNIELAHREDYSEPLPVFFPIDSATIEQNEGLIEDAHGMASKAIDWHKNSKWVDDSYFLIGKIQHLQADFDDAINTFKYLNVNSKKKDVRHQALVQLLHAFIDLKKFDDAAYVIDFLSKETGISKTNRQKLYLTLAYYYEVRGERDGIVSSLDKAVELTSNPKEKSRINFILGQLYQRAGFDAVAYEYYQKALKGNPPYERAFFSQLYSQQVVELEKSKDFKKVRKYYDELYDDRKNRDLRDVILYEKALFELKQDNQDEGIRLLTLAAKEESPNPRQKGYIYHKLSTIYFDEMKDYRAAKYYLDSAVENFKETDRLYASIQLKKKVLDDYVQNFEVIQKNDSLLHLASLPRDEQIQVAEAFIKSEEERLIREAEMKNQQKSTGIFDNLLAFGGRGGGSSFYFDNPTAMQQGSIDFYRIWGNRPLEDNWRRSSKGFQEAIGETLDQADSIENTETEEQPEIVLPDLDDLLNQIPSEKSVLNEMKAEMEESYFQLGKILYIDLKEPNRSIGYLNRLLSDYPQTPKKPEAYYTLYMASREAGLPHGQYKEILNKDFPDSPFTKSLNNPNQGSSSQDHRAAGELYRQAYELFNQKEYLSSRQLVRRALEDYPLTRNTEKLWLLDIMVSHKLDGENAYKLKLEQYLQSVEDKDLEKLARKMLALVAGEDKPLQANKNLDEKAELDTPDTLLVAEEEVKEPSPYKENLEQTHIFILALEPKQSQEAKHLTADLENFHSRHYANARLRTGTISINKENTLIIISPFGKADKALEYREKFLTEFNSDDLPPEIKNSSFVISIENFQQLNKRKDIEEYKAFYKEAYK